jgi:O-antigen biosynthesis protein
MAVIHADLLPIDSFYPESQSIAFEDASDPVVTIVVLGWRAAPHLLDCLRAVSMIDRSVTFEVIVTLNEPADQLVNDLKQHVTGARIIQSRVNLGFGGACNAAVRLARGRYIVLLNDDALVERNWLAPLVETAERRPEISAVGSLFLNIDGSLQESGSLLFSDGLTKAVSGAGAGVAHRFDWARRVDYCSGASLLIRKSIWERLGGFDEVYFPAYFEDVDLCMRVREIGHEVWLQPLSRVRHIKSASVDDSYKIFLTFRNLRQFVRRWSHVLEQRLENVGTEEAIEESSVWIGMGMPNRILIIDDRIPSSSLGSGYGRMLDALTDLTSTGEHFVSLFPTATGVGDRTALCQLGVRILEGDLATHLSQPHVTYDVVIISRPHNYQLSGELVRMHQPQATVIYDAEALYFRRILQQAQLTDDPQENEKLRAEAATMQRSEERHFADADRAVCISEAEARFARSLANAPPVDVISARLMDPRPTSNSFAARSDIVFVAGWLAGVTSPNADGLTWFVQKVLPLIRARIPWVRLRVTGQDPPSSLLEFASPNLTFEGYVGDLAALYRESRVAVVPIRFGAGVKLKTIEALQFGIPTVSTTVGAEGIETFETGALTVTDDPAEFAMQAAQLIDDQQLWENQQKRIEALHEIWADQLPGMSWRDVVEKALAASVHMGAR